MTTLAVQGTGRVCSAIGDATVGRVFDEADVLPQGARCGLERWRLPLFGTGSEFTVADRHGHLMALIVDRDDIPVTHQSDRAAFLSLGNDVSNYETVAST